MSPGPPIPSSLITVGTGKKAFVCVLGAAYDGDYDEEKVLLGPIKYCWMLKLRLLLRRSTSVQLQLEEVRP